MWTISVPHGREFQAHATSGIYMPHYGRGPDLSFLDQKFELDPCTNDRWLWRLNKQTAHAQIPNSRKVVTSSTPPVDPNALGCLDSRVVPS
jgi:hypothetical protein